MSAKPGLIIVETKKLRTRRSASLRCENRRAIPRRRDRGRLLCKLVCKSGPLRGCFSAESTYREQFNCSAVELLLCKICITNMICKPHYCGRLHQMGEARFELNTGSQPHLGLFAVQASLAGFTTQPTSAARRPGRRVVDEKNLRSTRPRSAARPRSRLRLDC